MTTLGIERRPKLLKDFLNDAMYSCSSSGFASFPRHQPPKIHSKPTNPKTISAFRALINAVKSIHFTAVKSPQFLPRSISRRLSKRGSKSTKEVRDIGWCALSRDAVAERSPPSDFTATNDSSSNSTDSSSLSWCESDFTEEFIPSWCGNSGEKKLQVLENVLPCNVDAIAPWDPQDGEMEDNFSSSFDESLANVEKSRQQLIEKIKEFESISNLKRSGEEKEEDDDEENNSSYGEEDREYNAEESAREMLVYMKATSSTKMSRVEEELIHDFFIEELKSVENQCYNWDVVRLAKSWLSRDFIAIDHGSEHHIREASLIEMNKLGIWTNVEVEIKDLGSQIGDDMITQLIDELMVDLLVN